MPNNIFALTRARFFAAFAIVLFHYEWALPNRELLPGRPVFQRDDIAVDFFFILSGFILAHRYGPAMLAQRFSFMDFITKRVARIYPVHFATLMFYVALAIVAGNAVGNAGRYDWSYLPAHLLMIQAWGPKDHGTFNYPSWSISCEFFAYLCFPLIAAGLFRLRTRIGAAWVAVLSALLLVVWWAVAYYGFGMSLIYFKNNFGPIRILPEFTLGVGIWMLLSQKSFQLSRSIWTLTAVIAALVLNVGFGSSDLVSVLLAAVVIFCFADRSRVQNAPPTRRFGFHYLGEISYSMYMVHVPVGTLVFNAWERLSKQAVTLPVVCVAIVIVFFAAAASFHLIEEPGRKLLSRPWWQRKPVTM
jgi:peptidoglycan/LPS O-acetylase OafA/YrhL